MAKKNKKKPAKKAVKKAAKKSPAKKVSRKPAKRSAAKKTSSAPVKRVTHINPYLTFGGNCEEAFNFYRSVFGGQFGYLGRFKDMPPGDKPMSEADGNLIMHVSLPISKDSILMGSDASAEHGGNIHAGNNFSISVSAVSKAEADKIYNGLSAGGAAFMPMSKTFWGSYFGMCKDKFGVQWMISYDDTPMM